MHIIIAALTRYNYMNRYFILLLLFIANLGWGQDFSAQWEGFFSYSSLVDVARSDSQSKIYAAAQNSIFVYDELTQQVETISTINGLSGENISEIYYSDDKQILAVGFENGLLQFIFEDLSVRTVVAIRDKIIIAPDDKRINGFLESGDLLYMATDFGIALYNLDLLEFDDTYFIGDGGMQINVNAIAINGSNIYAATSSGIRIADISNPFLLDFTNWNTVNSGVWSTMVAYNNRVYGTNQNGVLAQSNGTGTFSGVGISLPGLGRDATVVGANMVIACQNAVVLYDTGLNEVYRIDNVLGASYNYTSAAGAANIIYAATQLNGLIRVDISQPGAESFIIADGPVLNNAFSVTALPNEVWVTHGEHTLFYNPFPLNSRGVSHLVNEAWDNYTFNEVFGARSLSSVTVDPVNSNNVFVNSMHDGVVQIVDQVPTTVFDESNSTLAPVFSASGSFAGVRVSESAFDSSGNLWVLNAFQDSPLHRLTPGGQWSGIDFSSAFATINEEGGLNAITVDSRNRIILGTIGSGVLGYDPSNNSFAQMTEGLQQGGLFNNYIAALRIDQRGQLWIGSNLGLRVLFSASSLFSDSPADARPVIIEDDNGIPRELLADEAVLDIEVDGNNNKWVATGSSGAFLFNPSGRETIYHFTKFNSPLPDNEVRDISLDPATGLVYFATKNGLVAFRGDRASEPQDNLANVYAFPNPVRPGYEGNVTIDGLTNRARVKITDIEGNLVWEQVSQGGSVQWDTRSFSGEKVRSGVYMVFIATQDNIETAVSKIMVIR